MLGCCVVLCLKVQVIQELIWVLSPVYKCMEVNAILYESVFLQRVKFKEWTTNPRWYTERKNIRDKVCHAAQTLLGPQAHPLHPQLTLLWNAHCLILKNTTESFKKKIIIFSVRSCALLDLSHLKYYFAPKKGSCVLISITSLFICDFLKESCLESHPWQCGNMIALLHEWLTRRRREGYKTLHFSSTPQHLMLYSGWSWRAINKTVLAWHCVASTGCAPRGGAVCLPLPRLPPTCS